MKYVFGLTLSLTLFNFCFSQKAEKIPQFGLIDKNDLLLKECEFDKAAEAMVLFDVRNVYCTFYPNSSYPISSEVVRHVRIKILNDKCCWMTRNESLLRNSNLIKHFFPEP